MSLVANITSIYYVILLVGGLNWLVVGARLVLDPNASTCELGSGDASPTFLVPDALSMLGETVQIVVYYLVGACALLLLVFGVLGHWIRPGMGLITIDLKTVETDPVPSS